MSRPGHAGAPLTRDLLRLLAKAGDAGLTAGELTDEFPYPEDRARRNARINTTLNVQRRQGRVTRGPKERSAKYHGVPVYRWKITEGGLRHLEGKAHGEGSRALREDLQHRVADARDQLRLVRTALREGYGAHTPRHLRDPKVRELAAAGLDLETIAALFNLTRQRTHQLVYGRDRAR